jgi:hypothetical protein
VVTPVVGPGEAAVSVVGITPGVFIMSGVGSISDVAVAAIVGMGSTVAWAVGIGVVAAVGLVVQAHAVASTAASIAPARHRFQRFRMRIILFLRVAHAATPRIIPSARYMHTQKHWV